MKKMIRIVFALMIVCCCNTLQAKDPKIIKIDNLTLNGEIKTFEDASLITSEDNYKIGFYVYVKSALGVKSLLVNTRGEPDKKDIVETKDGYDVYVFKGVLVNSENKIRIQLCTDDKGEACTPMFITLQGNGDGTKCSFPSKQPCIVPNIDDFFGVNKASLHKDDIVYVYDFNKNVSNRRFYKITQTSEKPEPVNMTIERLCGNKQVFVKLAGVNSFVYAATINHTLEFLESEPPLLFKRMLQGDDTSIGGLLDLRNAKLQSKNIEEINVDNLIDDLKCFYNLYGQLRTEVLQAYDPCSCFPECAPSRIELLTESLSRINLDIALLEMSGANKKKELDVIKKVVEACKQIAALNSDIKKIEADDKLTAEDMKSQVAEKKTKLEGLKCPDDTTPKRADKIVDLEQDIAIIDNITVIKTKLPTTGDLELLSVFFSNMVSQNQSFWKGPIQLGGNMLNLDIEIKSRDAITTKFGIPTFSQTMNYKIPTLGKPFVSFSSGTFVAIGKHLQNKTYEWQEISPGTPSYRLVEKGYTELPIGFTALGNIEWKLTPFIGIGPSVGVGLTIEKDPRVAYLVGGSLFFGSMKQFAVTYGLAMMQVEKLSNNFQDIVESQAVYTTQPAIDSYKELKMGHFISLSYTLFTSLKK